MLSLAIPLVPRANPHGRRLRQNFFAELLPKGDARIRLAEQARVPRGDVMGMLGAYGRDGAGALQIWDPDQPGEPLRPAVEPVDGQGVEQMLRDVATAPLGNRPRKGKTSLNGVQNKIVLVRTADGWSTVLPRRTVGRGSTIAVSVFVLPTPLVSIGDYDVALLSFVEPDFRQPIIGSSWAIPSVFRGGPA